MDILNFAIQMERDGFKLYSESANILRDPAARRMLLSLAEDEKRHEQILQNFKAGQLGMIEGTSFFGIKNVFEELAAGGRGFVNENDDLGRVLRQGVEVETKSVELYRGLAEHAASAAERIVWQRLQSEEEKHEKLLSLTQEYIDKPNIVLENAEFLFYDHDAAP